MWSIILDYLFPPRPTELIVRSLTVAKRQLPRSITKTQGVTALLSYQHEATHAAIVENKFYHSERAATLLADTLSSWLTALPTPVICIPIPLSRQRLQKRKYNQVTNILERIQLAEVIYRTDLVARTRDTTPQTSLTKSKRKKNMRGAFAGNARALSQLTTPCTIVLVDDVLTTGATLEAARAALEPHLPAGVTLICVALAH